MNVFITRKIPEAGLQLLREASIQITEWTEKRDLTAAELVERCQDHQALLSAGHNKIGAEFLEACAHLKVVSLHSVGYDNVDVAAATRLKIPIGNTPGVLSGATADTAFLLMAAVARKAFYMHKKILQGGWGFSDPTADLGVDLSGKTLGIWGLGKIGYEMARRARAVYGMRIVYHNRGHNEEAERTLGAVRVSFDELLAQSDVLSVHTSLTPETAGTFNASIFRRMKRTAMFINTARGGIHHEPDLIAALQQGVLWGAGLDVTNPEPMAADNPLASMENVAVLPHIGSATQETRSAMAILAARNVIAGLRGERLPTIVNPEVYT
jgi:lactate dehydrogenase-like 2-hydroxyacid dehydrogenase